MPIHLELKHIVSLAVAGVSSIGMGAFLVGSAGSERAAPLLIPWVVGYVVGAWENWAMSRPMHFKRPGEPDPPSVWGRLVPWIAAVVGSVVVGWLVSGTTLFASLMMMVTGVVIGGLAGLPIARRRLASEMARPRRHDEHLVEIMDVAADPKGKLDRFFSPICECGWVGEGQPTLEEARSEARTHTPNLSSNVIAPLG